MTKVNIASMSRQELEAEYELSQWALTWALHKLGGSMEITPADTLEWSKQGRIWYSSTQDDAGALTTKVEFIEHSMEHLRGIKLIGVN